MVRVINFDLKAYKQTVLAGGIRGAALLERVRQVTANPWVFTSVENLRQANAFLLWHLAFSPDVDDRSALLASGVTSDFEASVASNQAFIRDNQAALQKEAIPGGILRHHIGNEDTTWLTEVFDDLEVDWRASWQGSSHKLRGEVVDRLLRLKVSRDQGLRQGLADYAPFARLIGEKKQPSETDFAYLVRKTQEKGLTLKGLCLTLTASIPEYRRFQVDPMETNDGVLFNQLRLAVAARYRTILMTMAGQGEKGLKDLLEIRPYGGSYVFAHQRDVGEQCLAFPGKLGKWRYLTAMLIKNGWPVGYAMASHCNSQDLGEVIVASNIFNEYRGFGTSSSLFNLLLGIVPRVIPGARKALIYRGVQAGLPGVDENQAHLDRFYLSHGFQWAGPELMTRELPNCRIVGEGR
ncbi:hypothetical protein A2311_06805 [candidate division WOR-1 bacterium RIFOXYB2_FULL_48_7]|uniref:N-acetyltransferase domain-containing protein n=1 Tax=candidate division WOR-1 bacterium RIFOXYB2_FULL_48_7 TaxID=1802583 RepID=A0A1F4TW25_UNCSA|nr:MAG: hypothetical protein A2311_06805 [candidate division WOR-1 bacterium RIFOXYB2_FULL_48_7]